MAALRDELKVLGTEDLVRAAQNGDRDAFGELCERFSQQVLMNAQRYLGDHGAAEELQQDVLLQAMLRIGQLRNPLAFGPWLRSITRRLALNRLVRRPPAKSLEPEELENCCEDFVTPLASAIKSEEALGVRAALDRLKALDRDTLKAFYFDGLSLREMSDEFKVPQGTVKRRLHVARKRLASEIDPLAV